MKTETDIRELIGTAIWRTINVTDEQCDAAALGVLEAFREFASEQLEHLKLTHYKCEMENKGCPFTKMNSEDHEEIINTLFGKAE